MALSSNISVVIFHDHGDISLECLEGTRGHKFISYLSCEIVIIRPHGLSFVLYRIVVAPTAVTYIALYRLKDRTSK